MRTISSFSLVAIFAIVVSMLAVSVQSSFGEVLVLYNAIPDGNVVAGTEARVFNLNISSQQEESISTVWFTCENYQAVESITFQYPDSDSNMIELTSEFEADSVSFHLGEDPIVLGDSLVIASVVVRLSDISEQVPSGINVQVNLGGFTVDDEVTQHELDGPLWRLLVSEPIFWSIRIIERLENGPVKIFSTGPNIRGGDWDHYQIPLIVRLSDDVSTDDLLTLSQFTIVFDDDLLEPGEDFNIITDDGRVLSDDGIIDNNEAQLCFIQLTEPLVFGHNGESRIDIWAEAGNVISGGGIDSLTVYIPDLDQEPISGTLDDLEGSFFIGSDGESFHNGWKFINIGEGEAEVITSEGELINAYPYNQPDDANIVAGTENRAINVRFRAGRSPFWLEEFSVELTEGLDDRSVESMSVTYRDEMDQTRTLSVEMEDGLAHFEFLDEPAFISANVDRVLQFEVATREIGPWDHEGKSGDLLQFRFSSENFVAHDGGGHEYLSYGGNQEIIGPYLCVRGNVPTVTIDWDMPNQFWNGSNDVCQITISADEGTTMGIVKVPILLFIEDSVPLEGNPLIVSSLQIIEDDMRLTEATTGANSFVIWSEQGERLSRDAELVCDSTGSLIVQIFVQFYDERILESGESRSYILRLIAEAVNIGANSNDRIGISRYFTDNDQPRTLYVDMRLDEDGNPLDDPFARLNTEPDLSGESFEADFIWSDFTGNDGNMRHNQYGENRSQDYISGLSILIEEDENEVKPDRLSDIEPREFLLNPAYPNPFNSSTTIRFSLPIADQVNLSVFDLSGRLITTLVDGQKPAGHHSAIWNGQSIPTGAYFVRMEAGEFSQVRRVMLVK